jgi:hypothetical protein
MIKRNNFGSKYIKVSSNNIRSWSASNGQFSLEEQRWKNKSPIYQAGIWKQPFSWRTEFRTKVNLNKEQCIHRFLLDCSNAKLLIRIDPSMFFSYTSVYVYRPVGKLF